MVWAGGVTVEDTVAATSAHRPGPNGRLVVDHDLAVPGHVDVYGVGDAAAVPWGGTGPEAETSARSSPRWPSSRAATPPTRS